ncbi:Uncharacterised protein [Mycobacteroides abscessus subsp. massiliense]|nr:Uncharacterised protein [Mycobacteroides abscessus subsp. massiliense]
MQAARFFNRTLRVFGQFRRNFEADEAGFAAGGFVFGKAHVASGLHIGHRHGFVALFRGQVLLFERGYLIGVQGVSGKGFLENGRIGSYATHTLLQHFCQFAALYQRTGEIVQPDLLS